MDTVKLMQARENGLKEHLLTLNQQRDQLMKAQTLDEESEKAAATAREYDAHADQLAEELTKLKAEKRKVLESSLAVLRSRMSAILDSEKGHAVFDIVDEKLVFGWMMRVEDREVFVPYAGLSGGQRVEFDSAFAYALLEGAEHGVVILEAAELGLSLTPMLDHIAKSNPDAQVFVNSCFDVQPEEVDGWQVFQLGEAHAAQ